MLTSVLLDAENKQHGCYWYCNTNAHSSKDIYGLGHSFWWRSACPPCLSNYSSQNFAFSFRTVFTYNKIYKKRPFSSIVAGDHILLVLSYRREMDISYIEMRCNCHALCTICVILLVIWVVNVCDASLVVLKVFDMLVASGSDSVTFSVDVVSSSSTTKRYK